MTELAERACVPCRGGVPPLAGDQIDALLKKLPAGWRSVDEHHLEKTFEFKNFRQALAFTNEAGTIAEEQRHHPDIYLSWGKVRLDIWTHKIDGLTESDFILAAKCDVAYRSMKNE
ncbi:MAG: 4a-hydroxytetrahydrobiopterin dehydratase [Candidatus Eremiobacteraeota bacterium]|nr:4a-hydroxytetrahydrobiopterin dehydratase [Candidatus Eremiobacteraeota bacterium]MBV9736686.1 4a-hydroxytetrahydrobiopterin dehydratase [Candidatus Eremiobacteraeota bacterium]